MTSETPFRIALVVVLVLTTRTAGCASPTTWWPLC